MFSEELVVNLFQQMPAIGVLVIVLVYLVKSLKESQSLLLKTLASREEKSQAIIHENTKTIGANSAILSETKTSLDSLKLTIAKANGKHLGGS